MKFKTLLIFGFLCSFTTVSAQDLENSLLWKVSGNGLNEDSYLFGTLHATCQTELKPRVITALEKTEQLALELDLSDMGMQMALAQKMYLSDGKSISDYLTEAETNQVKNLFEEYIPNMNFEMLNRIKPIFTSIMLTQNLVDCEVPKAYDTMLMQKAQSSKKPIFGLEDVQDQLAIFEAISIEDQVLELLKSAEDQMESDKAEFLKLVDLYEAEALTDLGKLMKEGDNVFNTYMVDILDKRNEKWIPKIEKMMHEKPSFFGFGAMHLVGEMGVIQLLRNQGYQVEAVLN